MFEDFPGVSFGTPWRWPKSPEYIGKVEQQTHLWLTNLRTLFSALLDKIVVDGGKVVHKNMIRIELPHTAL